MASPSSAPAPRAVPPSRDSGPDSPWSGIGEAAAVLLLCLALRLATTIRHIEDADSLRFALAMTDFDVSRLQPQFPGYPVFIAAARLLQALTGSYALAFSAIGGIGLFVLLHYALALTGWRFREPRGLALAALFAFNPMLWLLGNRYMSDLGGAALTLAAFYHLTRSRVSTGVGTRNAGGHLAWGFFLAGTLAGWRLSYLPFLAVALGAALLRREGRARNLAAGLAGVLAWLIPFIAATGWNVLLAAARAQTDGHFNDTGGTYRTEPGWVLRALSLLRDAWVDGLGNWEPGRHPATLVVTLGAAAFLARGAWRARAGRAAGDAGAGSGPALRLLAISCLAYALWIYFFQNVVNQTRHALPLVPPLLLLLAAGLRLPSARPVRAAHAALAAAFLAAYAFVGATLAIQHTRPAAIAQARNLLMSHPEPEALLVGAPWVVKCLSAQGVRLEFLAVETAEELDALRRLDPARAVIAVGDYDDRIDRPAAWRRTFYHNPYVNRISPRVTVTRYAPVAESSR